jgi:hypothetical protein
LFAGVFETKHELHSFGDQIHLPPRSSMQGKGASIGGHRKPQSGTSAWPLLRDAFFRPQ